MRHFIAHRFSLLRFAACCLALSALISGGQAQVYEKVFSFTDARTAGLAAPINKGSQPLAGLTQGTDGNYYGTTQRGGPTDKGTAFRLTQDGVFTTLVEFSDNGASSKGRYPQGILVQGRDDNFYGTTAFGGTCGVLLHLDLLP